jgi:hypothetical protein
MQKPSDHVCGGSGSGGFPPKQPYGQGSNALQVHSQAPPQESNSLHASCSAQPSTDLAWVFTLDSATMLTMKHRNEKVRNLDTTHHLHPLPSRTILGESELLLELLVVQASRKSSSHADGLSALVGSNKEGGRRANLKRLCHGEVRFHCL